MHDFGFPGRQVRHIASRVVEEDGEVVDADLVQGLELGHEIGLRGPVVVAIQLVGAQADAEAQAEGAAVG